MRCPDSQPLGSPVSLLRRLGEPQVLLIISPSPVSDVPVALWADGAEWCAAARGGGVGEWGGVVADGAY